MPSNVLADVDSDMEGGSKAKSGVEELSDMASPDDQCLIA